VRRYAIDLPPVRGRCLEYCWNPDALPSDDRRPPDRPCPLCSLV